MWTTHWNVLTNGEAIMDNSMAAWPVDTYLPLAEEAIQVRNCDLRYYNSTKFLKMNGILTKTNGTRDLSFIPITPWFFNLVN